MISEKCFWEHVLVFLFCGAVLSAGAVAVSAGDVQAGVWNRDFQAVRTQTMAMRKPMLLVCLKHECSSCYRLSKCLESRDFQAWQDARQIHMALVTAKDSQFDAAMKFALEGSEKSVAPPYVCVYWIKKDGTVFKKTFSGRRGQMPGARHEFLQMELISALDSLLKEYRPSGRENVEIKHMADTGVRCFSVATEGGAGRVVMDPPSGELTFEHDKVVLKVEEDGAGQIFWKWTGPDGKTVGYARKLTAGPTTPPGRYVAHFKPLDDCLPPEFSLRDSTVKVRVGQSFSIPMVVDDKFRPLSFRAAGKPFGMFLDSENGVFSGKVWRAGRYSIKVTAEGRDPDRTVMSREFVFEVEERNR